MTFDKTVFSFFRTAADVSSQEDSIPRIIIINKVSFGSYVLNFKVAQPLECFLSFCFCFGPLLRDAEFILICWSDRPILGCYFVLRVVKFKNILI